VACRCGIEDDVVVAIDQIMVGEQRRELVEGCDLRRAGAGQLLLDTLERLVRQNAAHGADDAVTVLRGRLFWIDLDGIKAGDLRNGRDVVADVGLEHLADVGGRIGADQKHLPAPLGQFERRGAGQRRLADTALAGEEGEFREVLEHGRHLSGREAV
jgi:hypothetical protein